VGRSILGPQTPQAQVNLLDRQLGLDHPVLTRYFDWLGGFVRGDWGRSFTLQVPVRGLVFERTWNTFKLSAVALVLLVPTSIGAGVIAALREGKLFDRVLTVVGVSLTVVPEFVSGVVLLVILGLVLRWFPTTAQTAPGAGFFDVVYHLLLPALPIVMVLFGYFARMARAGTLEVLDAAYVRTATFKGLSRGRVIVGHVLRNALPPTITLVALQTGFILSGIVVVEQLFNYPGLGQLLLASGTSHDIPTLEAGSLLVGVFIMGLNLAADVVHFALDPRSRAALRR
jgi:peptide/nickel transport system permease protein